MLLNFTGTVEITHKVPDGKDSRGNTKYSNTVTSYDRVGVVTSEEFVDENSTGPTFSNQVKIIFPPYIDPVVSKEDWVKYDGEKFKVIEVSKRNKSYPANFILSTQILGAVVIAERVSTNG